MKKVIKKNKNLKLSRKDKKFLAFVEDCIKKAKETRKNKDHSKFYNNYLKPTDPNRTFSSFKSLFEEELKNKKIKFFVAPKKSTEEYERKISSLPEHLREREKAAIEIAKKRNKAIAPICNKGAYQPISLSDLQTIGKKI